SFSSDKRLSLVAAVAPPATPPTITIFIILYFMEAMIQANKLLLRNRSYITAFPFAKYTTHNKFFVLFVNRTNQTF
ncbi:MAG TPA: hypothetical protein PL084_09380, partial [Chitinophagales bacterium]|nr:hypothetical protein [Chitinophagales bacterium]